MNFTIRPVPPEPVAADLFVLGVREASFADDLAPLGSSLGGHLADTAKGDEFTGKAGTSQQYATFGGLPSERLLLVGLGAGTSDDVRRAAGIAGSTARARGAKSVRVRLGDLDADRTLAAVEGFGIGQWRFDRYKPETDRKAAADEVVFEGTADGGAVPLGKAIVDGAAVTRDLVSESAANVYPDALAQSALGLAGDGLTVEVWDEVRIREAGMGGISAVGQGSARPPRFVHMRWTPGGKARARVAIVGKGVTFDSGGLSLKPNDGMLTMRCDMAGAAAVIGLFRALKDVRPQVEVHGIFGTVENMPSGTAYKLGDVLRIYNGKTVEVHNTDAEGRLVLADCLSYASKLGVQAVVDLATLTGACVVALGPAYSGLFTSDDALAGALLARAAEAGEGLWRLPMPDSYKDRIKAEWGSIKNTGGREAGASIGALFLSEFVEGVPWAHVDIAGPAFFEKTHRHFAAGGTGAMVPTLVRWIRGM